MSLVNPILGLVGLACVAIPIAIHILMRRRRRPVMWGAMRFLVEAYRRQRRRIQLEQLLLLAARCLVVALVALALGRPVLAGAGLLGRGALTVYLVIDNSLTGAAVGPDGRTAIARHQEAARRLLAQLDPAAGDRAGLVALGAPAESLVVPASSNIASVGELVADLHATDGPADIGGALAAIGGASAAEEVDARAVVVVLSDFLAGTGDASRVPPEARLPAGASLLASTPAPTGPGNVTVAHVEPWRSVVVVGPEDATTQRQMPVRVDLRRSGQAVAGAARTGVSVRFEGVARGALSGTPARGSVEWRAGQTEASLTLNAPLPERAAGPLVVVAEIDADALAGDNLRRRLIDARASLRVGVVAPRRFTGAGPRPGVQQFEPSDWIRVALEPEADGAGQAAHADVQVVEVDPSAVDAARLAGLDAVILARPDSLPEAAWARLRVFADGGGVLIVTPPADATVHLWADPFVRELGLPWSVAREARTHEPARTLAGTPPGAGPGVPRLLELLEGELAELVRPVSVTRHLPIEGPGDQLGPVLTLDDGTPLIVGARPGAAGPDPGGASGDESRGLVVLLAAAFDFDWTDLQARPLMVPLMQELVRQGVGSTRAAWQVEAGANPRTPVRTAELRPVGKEAPAPVPVGPDGRTLTPMRRAGVWRAVDEGGGERGIVIVNSAPEAGRTDAQDAGAVSSWLARAGSGVEVRWLDSAGAIGRDPASGQGPSLRAALERGGDTGRIALGLLIGALAVAGAELVMARFFSHASASPGGGTP